VVPERSQGGVRETARSSGKKSLPRCLLFTDSCCNQAISLIEDWAGSILFSRPLRGHKNSGLLHSLLIAALLTINGIAGEIAM